ncbi:heat-inducible transcriptional repressor HrcA [Neiella marina]|uniref:Heat-inducible transcription repressor HrcA n=1 Tax=Neiella holothuriorum TaxID=2870530 RepID=A0ABS7EGL1_9GAMM|nr:heat-inducible transcriptional repressor HrcA [Neiella holothuriorum]MBW8191415.1 heat-inducible transcriptional repressor HrcA [Neiella holothuriorum]
MTQLNDRAQQVLQQLIEEFIRSGVPVGSKALTANGAIQASSATVRNVMAQLEKMGYLMSPHTSAGRIPTEDGLRVFVDSMLAVRKMDDWQVPLQQQLDISMPTQQLCQSASDMLAELTQLTGFVVLPQGRPAKLIQVELVALGNGRVLAVLVHDDGSVHNRMMQLHQSITAECLRRMSEQLNKLLPLHSLDQLKLHLRQWIDIEDEAIAVGQQALALADLPTEGKRWHIAGEEHLLDPAIAQDISQIRHVFDGVLEAGELLNLINSCLDSDGVQLFIGKESGIDFLSSCTVVSSPYQVEGEVVGALAVIGPMRMDYNKVVPLVDVTAKMLSLALKRARG